MSAQGLQYLSFHLHLLDAVLHCKTCPSLRTGIVYISGVPIFRIFMVNAIYIYNKKGASDAVDRMFAVHAGSRGFDHHRHVICIHMSERRYPHPVRSGLRLKNSGIRVAGGYCSVTERWRCCPLYETGKTVHERAEPLQTQRGRDARRRVCAAIVPYR